MRTWRSCADPDRERSAEKPEETMDRRKALKSLAGISLCGLAAQAARAQSYPTRPVKMLVGFGVGGNGDVTVRIIAEKVSARLGQPWVVENRPSAGGIIASQVLLQSPADGYTLMLGASSNVAMAPSLFKSLSFDPARDFAPVSLVSKFGFLIAVNGASRIRTVAELIAEAKARPGGLSVGSLSVGSAPHIGVELFKSIAGIDMVTVPFKTSGDLAIAGRTNSVQVVLDTIPPLVTHFQGDALRPIAITSAERFPGLPNVPTALESGTKFEFMSWNGILAPKGTPEEVLDILNREVRAALQLPDVVEKYRLLGAVATGSTRQQFQSFIESEIVSWRRTLEIARIPTT
jgi:tripartite-type tricarboxylate transporter receptor subunit TctC